MEWTCQSMPSANQTGLFFSSQCLVSLHSVHVGINLTFPLKAHPPFFLAKSFLKSAVQTVQAPFCRQSPLPIYWMFVTPLKIKFFSERQKY